MLDKFLQIESLSIVFLGEFNPVIIQPFWLANKQLIREQEATSANIEIIHNEIVKYDLDWVFIEITKNRCLFKTSKTPYFSAVKDLSTSIFKILKETPIKALGINHMYDLSLRDQDQYWEFGNKITPLNIWEESINDPRLLSVEIFEQERKDSLPGQFRIRITPSDQQIQFGISFNINNHFDLEPGKKGINLEMVRTLEDQWNKSFNRGHEVVTNILNKTLLNEQ